MMRRQHSRAKSRREPFTLADFEAARNGTAAPAKGKRHKFGAVAAVDAEGRKFQSTKEARRSVELEQLQRIGEISDLRRQVRYEFVINGCKVCAYDADFVYQRAGREVVEDTKSIETRKNRAYRIKVKLMRAVFGIEVEES
jgi:hypothetical protein